jgi:peptidoglycan/xylan/chitin deacetylase (PgdA/CDA1 family)
MKIAVSLCLVFLTLVTGFQKVDHPQPTPILPPLISSDARLVCLFFDDGFYNQYEMALPLLLKYGFQATFGVVTDYIARGQGLLKCMNEKELKELAEYGMDIASHTRTHPQLTQDLTEQQLRMEIIDSKTDLEKMGFSVNTFIYPYDKYDDRVLEYVKEAGYTYARSGWSREGVYELNNNDLKARYHVASWSINNQDMDYFKNIVSKANYPAVVCLVYHLISDEGPEGITTPIANFLTQMAYLKQTGYTVILLPEVIMPR